MFKKLFRNDYFQSVFTKIFKLCIGLFASAFLTRYLGLQFKGDSAFINQAVSVSGLILNLGIYQSYTYYYRQEGQEVFSKYMSLVISQFILYLIVAICIAAFTRDITITLICLTVPFRVMHTQLDNIMLVQNVKSKMQSTRIFALVTMTFNLILLLVFPASVVYAVLAGIIVDILAISRYFFKEKASIHLNTVETKFALRILRFGFLPMLSALLVTLNYSVDIFFLKRIGTQPDLSLYSVAAGIMNYVWLVPDAFKDILYSRVARNNQKSSVAFSTKFSLLFLIITTLGFAVLGKPFISIMYGKDFIPSYNVTLVLFLGVYSMIFFKIFGIVMLAEGRRVPFFVILMFSVVLNVILNYALIPSYGMYGAAYASVGSYNLCGILFLIYFSKTNHIHIRDLILINKSDIQNMKAAMMRFAGRN